MPCTKCEEGKYKWGETGECEYATLQDCEDANHAYQEMKTTSIVELVIDENTITQNDYKLQVLDILKTQDKKNSFQNIRQLLADSKVSDFSDLFRLLFDTIDDWATGHIAECILILSKYQQSDAVVVDKEINIMAMFVEIIGTIK